MPEPEQRGRRYERWAAEYMRSLVPDGTVEHDVRLPGRGGGMRQIDVLVTTPVAGLREPLRIAVECKDWKRRVPVGEVGKLRDLMDDVGVPLGLLLTPTGFTAGAVRRAAELPGVVLEV